MSFFSNIADRFKAFRDRLMARPFFKVVLSRYFLAGLFFVVWIVLIDRNNVIMLFKTEKDIDKLRGQKTYYENGIQSADRKLGQLKSNRDSLEKFAREEYYFLKDSEDVYVFEKKN